MIKKNIKNIIKNLSRIIPGEVAGFYQKEFNEWISLNKVEEILEILQTEGLIKGSNRSGYTNLARFECKCVKCYVTFKSIRIDGNMCYDCIRAIQIPIENELIPTFREREALNNAMQSINQRKEKYQRRYENRRRN